VDIVSRASRARGAAAAITLIVSLAAACNDAPRPGETLTWYVGSWGGVLSADGARIALTISIAQTAGVFQATLDVPSQSLRGFSASETRVGESGVSVSFASIGARFEAKRSEESLDGAWIQGGREFPLVLSRAGSAADPEYLGEEVHFPAGSGGATLAGSLLVPEGDGPFPLAILLSGSGAQDRDETIAGHKPFETIAAALLEAGIASLRYDDRGVGGSSGDFQAAGLDDFAADAIAAWNFARRDARFGSIGFIGHSEGGVVALDAAARLKDASFVVTLASPYVDGRSLLLMQSRALLEAMGADPASVEEANRLNGRIFDLAAKSGPYPRDEIDETLVQAGLAKDARDAQHAALSSKWFAQFLRSDPLTLVGSIGVPILAYFGDRDLQVPYAENVANAAAALSGRPGSEVRTWSGLNHLFQPAITGLPDEYGSIGTGFDPGVAREVAAWIARTAPGSRAGD
jgi:hypothetical protein